MAVKTYDTKSYELAEYFYDGDPTARAELRDMMVHSLALEIQQAVEDWYEDNRRKTVNG